jgi:hypothetical protein
LPFFFLSALLSSGFLFYFVIFFSLAFSLFFFSLGPIKVFQLVVSMSLPPKLTKPTPLISRSNNNKKEATAAVRMKEVGRDSFTGEPAKASSSQPATRQTLVWWCSTHEITTPTIDTPHPHTHIPLRRPRKHFLVSSQQHKRAHLACKKKTPRRSSSSTTAVGFPSIGRDCKQRPEDPHFAGLGQYLR